MRGIDSRVQRTLGFAEIGEALTGDGGVVEYMNVGTFITPTFRFHEAGVPGEVNCGGFAGFTFHSGGNGDGINGDYITHGILLC
jgi:hypothetical protein